MEENIWQRDFINQTGQKSRIKSTLFGGVVNEEFVKIMQRLHQSNNMYNVDHSGVKRFCGPLWWARKTGGGPLN